MLDDKAGQCPTGKKGAYRIDIDFITDKGVVLTAKLREAPGGHTVAFETHFSKASKLRSAAPKPETLKKAPVAFEIAWVMTNS